MMPESTVLAILLAAGAFAGTDATAKPNIDYATGIAELRRNMLASHSTFDGTPVIDVRMVNRCAATIVTTRGATAVRWKDLGPLIVRLENGHTLFRVPARDKIHVLSAETGKVAMRINMGLGLLDQQCGGA